MQPDENLIKAMKEELEHIEKNQALEIVLRLENKNVIGSKWVFKRKLNEDGNFFRNKARLVCKGYYQVEWIYFEEKYLLWKGHKPLEFFGFFGNKYFKVYQVDVNFLFLNGELEEEVYI